MRDDPRILKPAAPVIRGNRPLKHLAQAFFLAGVAGLVLILAWRMNRGPGPPAGPTPSGDAPGSAAQRDPIRAFWSSFESAQRAFHDGQYASAADAYRAALALRPGNETCLFNLAVACAESGDAPAALDALRQCIDANGNDAPRAHLQLARWLAGPPPGFPFDPAAAEAELRRYLTRNQEESGPFLLLGRIALTRSNPDAALRHLDVVRRFSLKCPEADFLSGVVAMEKGDPAAAAGFFLRPIQQAIAAASVSIVASEGDTRADLAAATIHQPHLLPFRWALLSAASALGYYPDTIPAAVRLPPPLVPHALSVVLQADRQPAGPDTSATPSPSDETASVARVPDSESRFLEQDVDGDGDLDLLTIPNPWQAGECRLFLRGAGGVTNDTDSAGLAGKRSILSAAFLDADSDGDADLLEAGPGAQPLRLWRQERGRFSPSELDFGLPPNTVIVDLCPADVDQDGRTDFFALAWKAPSRLFLNRGHHFEDATRSSGLEITAAGYRAAWLDFDRDGDLDLLVAPHAPAVESLPTRFAAATPGPHRLQLHVQSAMSFRESG
ncbi:MAG: VCBS repeat-containing protein, partial [Planctomycetes bacterium]|nr:VCBS repeat-containing protein [Planctomycetota bacterium]